MEERRSKVRKVLKPGSSRAERLVLMKIATAARRTRSILHEMDGSAALTDENAHVDELLKLLERGEAPGAIEAPVLGADKHRAEFEDVDPSTLFTQASGVQRSSGISKDRLADGAEDILRAVRSCTEIDEDHAHWAGPFGSELSQLVQGLSRPNPNIRVVRAMDATVNPVALLTPHGEEPLAAVAARDIEAGEPVALYTGELVAEHDCDLNSSTYVYDVSRENLSARGYPSEVSPSH